MSGEATTSTADSFSKEVAILMGQGKRHLVCSEVVQAVKCFEEATKKLDEKYGPCSNECGEAYLFYGKALLEVARSENGVLGNTLQNVADSKSEESSDDDEDVIEAEKSTGGEVKGPAAKDEEMKEVDNTLQEDARENHVPQDTESKSEEKEKEVPQETESKLEEKVEDVPQGTGSTSEEMPPETESKTEEKEERVPEEHASKLESEKSTEVLMEHKEKQESNKEEVEGREGQEEGGSEDETTEGKQDDGDLPTMQLAWETLELARIVFSREESREAQLNLAQVYLKLGEIQLEQELFVGAAEDFQKCFDLQQKYLEPDDRLIAETTYNIGLANFLQPNYPNAKEFFSKALKVIELRITHLEARIAELESTSKGKEKATDDNPSVLDRKELEELRELYPEIKAKVDDAHEMMLSSQTTAEGTTEEGFGSSGQHVDDTTASKIPVKSSTLPVSDVSHLVRRKRKPEEDSSDPVNEGVVPLKKARQEEENPATRQQDEETPGTNNGHVTNGSGTTADQQ